MRLRDGCIWHSRVERLTNWVSKQPLVDPNGLGIIAGSKGTEAGLLPATTNHKIKAVAAIAPSAYVFWEIRGPGSYADFDKFTVDEVYPRGFIRPIPFGQTIAISTYDGNCVLAVKDGVLTAVSSKDPLAKSSASQFKVIDCGCQRPLAMMRS